LHRETGRELLGIHPKMPAITLQRSYDAMGRLQDLLVLPAKGSPGQSITGQPPEEHKPEIPQLMDLSRHHHYNRIGQLEHIEQLRLHPAAQPWHPPQRQAHRSQRYTYDAQQRLEFEGVHSVAAYGRDRLEREQHWHYDSAGNRIHPDDTRYRPLERAAPGNRLHRSAHARYRHDAWGNVVQIDHTAGPHKGRQVRLAYDGEHRLLASERIQTNTDGQRHSVLTRYHYDPMSRRVGKQHLKRIPKGEGQKSEWHIQSSLWFGWDGDRMVTMQNESQASTTIYEPDSFVPMLRIDRQLQADERRAKGETRTYHVHCNHLGTPEALIAQDGLELVWQIELDPWGQTQREYNPKNLLQPIRMQGQQVDAETGLFYNRYRYYDPAGGRYITQDPIGLAGGVNLYGYVGGDPVQLVDPLGLVVPLVVAGLAFIGATFGGGANVIKQKQIDKKCKVNWFETGNATVWGAVGGALLPFVAPLFPIAGPLAVGGATGAGQYVTGSAISGEAVTTGGFVINTGMGAAGGAIGGAPARVAREISSSALPAIAARDATLKELGTNLSLPNTVKNAGGAATGSVDPSAVCLTCKPDPCK
jgi:RHS repeat-associated protein